ncbi:MAG: hypothetical protein M3280_09320 [Actinomycetota bacterium]|nr:hypothetical protein [Actinomycetota bacterium]
MRRGRNTAYYTCEVNRRQSGLVPEDHPRMVYLREDKAGEKVVEFLATHLFSPGRIEALKQSLAEIGPEADNAHAETKRLLSELDGIKRRIRRLVTNLEAQEPDSEIADDIRGRLEELAALRAKKQRELEAAEKETAQSSRPGVGGSSRGRSAASGRGLGACERSGVPRPACPAELRSEV